jgi:hypothetical protein
MKSFKMFIQILVIAAVAASVTACSSKKGSKSSVRPRTSSRNYDPRTAGPAPGSYPQNTYSQWGEIIGFNRYALAQFLGVNENEFGEVSAQSNQQTGVRFYGNINQQGSGNVYIFIYDSYALQGMGPIELPVFQCQGYNQGGTIVLNCQDGNGELTLSGQEIGNEFSGQVSFNGGNSLGQFRISACGFLGCY